MPGFLKGYPEHVNQGCLTSGQPNSSFHRLSRQTYKLAQDKSVQELLSYSTISLVMGLTLGQEIKKTKGYSRCPKSESKVNGLVTWRKSKQYRQELDRCLAIRGLAQTDHSPSLRGKTRGGVFIRPKCWNGSIQMAECWMVLGWYSTSVCCTRANTKKSIILTSYVSPGLHVASDRARSNPISRMYIIC